MAEKAATPNLTDLFAAWAKTHRQFLTSKETMRASSDEIYGHLREMIEINKGYFDTVDVLMLSSGNTGRIVPMKKLRESYSDIYYWEKRFYRDRPETAIEHGGPVVSEVDRKEFDKLLTGEGFAQCVFYFSTAD